MRSWQVERRKRTRHLIELGGLVVKAGIVDLTGDDRTIIYGALIWMIQSNMPVHVGHRLESAKIIPDAGQNPHHLLGAVVLKDAGGRQKVVGHQEFKVILGPFKHEGHRAVPVIAGMNHEQAIRLGLPVMRRACAVEVFEDLGAGGIGQVTGQGLGQDLGPGRAVSGRDHAGVGQTGRIHEAKRGESVEPGIGSLFDDLLAALCDRNLKLADRCGVFAPRRRALGQHHIKTGGDLIDQQVARGLSKLLQRIGIHQTVTFLPAAISASRVFRISSR